MIEVEKKIVIGEEELKKIESQGTFLETQIITDTYFDTPDFRYTTSDIWLRERECKFELKIAVKGFKGNVDKYEEILEEQKILEKLGLEKDKDIQKALLKAGIFPFATLQTIRRKYQIEQFTIYLDLAYFDDFIYRIAEIELLVTNEAKIPQAEKTLAEFMRKFGFHARPQPVKAKLIEFLSQKNPTHYQALRSAGIVQ